MIVSLSRGLLGVSAFLLFAPPASAERAYATQSHVETGRKPLKSDGSFQVVQAKGDSSRIIERARELASEASARRSAKPDEEAIQLLKPLAEAGDDAAIIAIRDIYLQYWSLLDARLGTYQPKTEIALREYAKWKKKAANASDPKKEMYDALGLIRAKDAGSVSKGQDAETVLIGQSIGVLRQV